ncbi:cytochrome P450 CYP736A12-like [Gossypium hirsutum]|uniref:Cytochrome P450 CYP736A12-like n=1 Tax=Gossypium hirsutum TaxID=3635 RepID=A0ABM2YNJ9_GOSHI|nr:cytochrome P450 CYP736A12-like [Gossypium hirsutum]
MDPERDIADDVESNAPASVQGTTPFDSRLATSSCDVGILEIKEFVVPVERACKAEYLEKKKRMKLEKCDRDHQANHFNLHQRSLEMIIAVQRQMWDNRIEIVLDHFRTSKLQLHLLCGSLNHFIRDCPESVEQEIVQNLRPSGNASCGRPPRNTRNEAAAEKEVVNISKKVGNLNAEIILNKILGPVKKYKEFNLKELIEELLYMVGVFNLVDFVPFLGAFDLQGLKAHTRILGEKLDKALKTIINDHQQQKQDDFISTMLTEQINPNGDIMDRNCIKAITVDMIVASLDTSTALLEWALLALIKHPRVMSKLQKELERIIRMRMVEENDLPKLEYLDMVVKETLRLYLVAPMLIPRESMEDIVIDGCYIPKRSRVIVNV